MVRPPCCEKLNVKKGNWTEEEDAKMLAYVSKHGTGNWTAVPKKAGLRRCGKSCRLRWTNYLRPDIRHESFTPQEEELIVKLHAAIGTRWSMIAQQLPGRTDNDVKNYWNTKLKKKLTGMGIDHVTHRPFSQILADYGTICDLTKSGNRIGSLSNKDLKTAFMSKSKATEFSNINTHMMTPILSSVPKTEPIQDSFFNTTNINNHTDDNNNNSTYLLSQLQAIKLVTEATNWAKNHETDHALSPCSNFFHETGSLSSSSSSSSSTCSTAGQARSPLAFSWRDFLIDDDLLPAANFQQQLLQEQENMLEFSSKELSCQATNEAITQINNYNGVQATECGDPSINGFHASSSADTFVEAMLDRENEMFLEFPDLLEEPFYN